jgi:hypothetical protein
MPGALTVPNLLASPNIVAPSPAAPVQPQALAAILVPPAAAAKAVPAKVEGSPLAVIQSQDAKVGVAEKGIALNVLFDNLTATGRGAAAADGELPRDHSSPLRPDPIRPSKRVV